MVSSLQKNYETGKDRDYANYITWLKDANDKLINEINLMIEEVDDEPYREILSNIVRLVNINQNLNTLYIVNLMLHARERELKIDEDLYEISEYMASILDVHLNEAENLGKIL